MASDRKEGRAKEVLTWIILAVNAVLLVTLFWAGLDVLNNMTFNSRENSRQIGEVAKAVDDLKDWRKKVDERHAGEDAVDRVIGRKVR